MNFGSKKLVRKPSSVLVIDFGASAYRLVEVQKKSERFVINRLARRKMNGELLENFAEDSVAEGLKNLLNDAKIKQKQQPVYLTINCPSTVVKYVETPMMTLEDARRAIRLNSVQYLRQDCTDYFLDCAALPAVPTRVAPPKEEGKSATKMNILVAGARRNEVKFFDQTAAKALLEVKAIGLNPLSVINAFEAIWGKSFRDEATAVVDIGLRRSSLTLMQRGTPVLTRMIDWGGDSITHYITEMLSIELESAEEEKLKMSEPVQQLVKDSLLRLLQQIQASLDFFDNQYGVPVSRVGVSGGTATALWIVQCLNESLGIPCEPWKPTANFELGFAKQEALTNTLTAEYACAVGAAISFLS